MGLLYALLVLEGFVIPSATALTVCNLYLILYRNIRKVASKYVTCICFFYINIVVCHKEYWKIIWDIRFYNSCFKFGCGNRVNENMIYSCCSFPSNVCQFVYDWHHVIAKHNINKFLYFIIFFWYQAGSYWNHQPLLATSLRCRLLIVFYRFAFKFISRHHLEVYVSNSELCFSIFHLLLLDITIEWYHNLVNSLI